MGDSKNRSFKNIVNHSPYLHPVIKYCIKYRYLFFALAATCMWIDSTFLTGRSLIGLYSIVMLYLGIVFPHLWEGILQSLLVTLCMFSIYWKGFHVGIEEFIFQWLSYFSIWFATSIMIKKIIEKREGLIKITTAFAATLDAKDKYTAHHSINVARYSVLIARELGLSKQKCSEIEIGAQLHDIGKIGIPENILNKPSKLTMGEFEVIKSHPRLGYEMLKGIKLFENIGVLDAILYHHEREDGSGYPAGLKSEEIPMVAKIVAVADTFDAVTSKRVYREKQSFEYAVNEIISNKGKWYDPVVVEAFNKIIKREGIKILETPIEVSTSDTLSCLNS